jgi:hypothetical protein
MRGSRLRFAIACASLLPLLGGCGNDIYDMTYYPPVGQKHASAPPVPAETTPPPVADNSGYAPAPAAPAPLAPERQATTEPAAPVMPPPVARAAPEPPQAAPPAPAPVGLPDGAEPAVAMEPAVPASAPAPPLAPPSDFHCRNVAQQRADDAGVNGLDEATQHAVFDGTYANCMKWAAKSN